MSWSQHAATRVSLSACGNARATSCPRAATACTCAHRSPKGRRRRSARTSASGASIRVRGYRIAARGSRPTPRIPLHPVRAPDSNEPMHQREQLPSTGPGSGTTERLAGDSAGQPLSLTTLVTTSFTRSRRANAIGRGLACRRGRPVEPPRRAGRKPSRTSKMLRQAALVASGGAIAVANEACPIGWAASPSTGCCRPMGAQRSENKGGTREPPGRVRSDAERASQRHTAGFDCTRAAQSCSLRGAVRFILGRAEFGLGRNVRGLRLAVHHGHGLQCDCHADADPDADCHAVRFPDRPAGSGLDRHSLDRGSDLERPSGARQ